MVRRPHLQLGQRWREAALPRDHVRTLPTDAERLGDLRGSDRVAPWGTLQQDRDLLAKRQNATVIGIR
jgi:hypothetical protein